MCFDLLCEAFVISYDAHELTTILRKICILQQFIAYTELILNTYCTCILWMSWLPKKCLNTKSIARECAGKWSMSLCDTYPDTLSNIINTLWSYHGQAANKLIWALLHALFDTYYTYDDSGYCCIDCSCWYNIWAILILDLWSPQCSIMHNRAGLAQWSEFQLSRLYCYVLACI